MSATAWSDVVRVPLTHRAGVMLKELCRFGCGIYRETYLAGVPDRRVGDMYVVRLSPDYHLKSHSAGNARILDDEGCLWAEFDGLGKDMWRLRTFFALGGGSVFTDEICDEPIPKPEDPADD